MKNCGNCKHWEASSEHPGVGECGYDVPKLPFWVLDHKQATALSLNLADRDTTRSQGENCKTWELNENRVPR